MKDFCKGIIYIGAFATLFIPFLVSDSMFFPYITGKNFAFRILVEVIFASWIILALLDARYRPRWSLLLAGTSTLLIVMFFANLFSEYSPKSFWSNFERMDGYVTLVHFYLYFIVAGSVFIGNKVWNYFLVTSIGAASLVALRGLSDYLGGSIGDARIDSTLGNSTYMALYMLFNIFLLAILAVQKNTWKIWLAASPLFGLFVYVLLQTGTRGTFIGLIVGVFVTVAYFAIFSHKHPELRRVAIGSIALFLLLIGGFWALKESSFIQNNPALVRYANIDLGQDLETRMTIWNMAWDGFKERPVLGWGQGSFNYVFNQNFHPDLYGQESWFDRVHNIVLDWLVAGGILGFVAYLSIFVFLAYYLFWLPLFTKESDQFFAVEERAILVGLISGYVIHNMVVFDNLISYMFFAIVLAYVHVRVSRTVPQVESFKISTDSVIRLIAPAVVVVTLVAIYLVNVPAMKAATDIIDSFRTNNAVERLFLLQQAYDRDVFADQEIAEQMSLQAAAVAQSDGIPQETKLVLLQQIEAVMFDMISKKPNDARLYTMLGNFYLHSGSLVQAEKAFQEAHKLSPNKQEILLQLGLIVYQQDDLAGSLVHFKEAYELAPQFTKVRMMYAAGLLLNGYKEEALGLVGDDFDKFADSQLSLLSVIRSGDIVLLERILVTQIENKPLDIKNYRNLIIFYYEQGINSNIETVLNQMVDKIPSSSSTATCVRQNISLSKNPYDGC